MDTGMTLLSRSGCAVPRPSPFIFSQITADFLASLFSRFCNLGSIGSSLALPAPRSLLFFLSHRVLVSLTLTIALGVPDAMADAADPRENGHLQGPTRLDLLTLIAPGIGHMLLNLGHILFLMGVFFFLFRLTHVGTYVSLFVLGHFTAMIFGVYFGLGTNIYLINVMLGLSVVYKVVDNLGGFQRWRIIQPNPGLATLVFATFHGVGVATNILEYQILPYGLVRDVLA
ncbi:HupE/UreJ family protein [Ottowia sp. VDI28]|uniref:HupE/UreJ family protein n=1 Tax=Ottowia sp. VDI28 TaxID=3133968 RepID=UPI003C2F5B91